MHSKYLLTVANIGDVIVGIVVKFGRFLEMHDGKRSIQENTGGPVKEVTALQILLNQPQARQWLTFEQLKELAQQIAQPPLSLTTEALWRAYAQLEQGKVRGVRARRVLSDLVALAGPAGG